MVDLKGQYEPIKEQVNRTIQEVIDTTAFINGPEVHGFQKDLEDYLNVKHVIPCANGTDALQISLMALGVGPGDAVFVPSFTFTATAEAIVLVGATPVFVDINTDTFNIDPTSLEEAIESTKDFRRSAIIAVDLFGQPADFEKLEQIAADYHLDLLVDAAQSLGGRHKTSNVGTLGDVTTTSFFPSKPLGCYGDGGAVLTKNDQIAEAAKSIRVHGSGSAKYENSRFGLNSRLDTLQAAILLAKLPVFDEEIVARRQIADRYSSVLSDVVKTPIVRTDVHSVWANYTIKVSSRDSLRKELQSRQIPTAVYYPKSIHQRGPYREFPTAPKGLLNSERVSKLVLSLPIHPYLDHSSQNQIINAVTDLVSVEKSSGAAIPGIRRF